MTKPRSPSNFKSEDGNKRKFKQCVLCPSAPIEAVLQNFLNIHNNSNITITITETLPLTPVNNWKLL